VAINLYGMRAWRAERSGWDYVISEDDGSGGRGRTVATVYTPPGGSEDASRRNAEDARELAEFIATAPAMWKAIKVALGYAETGEGIAAAASLMRRAIAGAEPEPDPAFLAPLRELLAHPAMRNHTRPDHLWNEALTTLGEVERRLGIFGEPEPVRPCKGYHISGECHTGEHPDYPMRPETAARILAAHSRPGAHADRAASCATCDAARAILAPERVNA